MIRSYRTLFFVLILLTSSLVYAENVYVGVHVNTTPVTTIDDHFVGVTVDSGLLPTPKAFEGLNFSSPKIIVLGKGLAPSFLRIGGTSGDRLKFDPTGHDPDVQNTFTGKTWDTINHFVQTVGWDFIFGVNALIRSDGVWNSSNAVELLAYTSQRNYTLYGLELGNEPDHYTNPVSAKQLGADLTRFRAILKATPGYESALVIGPDTASVDLYFDDFIKDCTTGTLDNISFHQYYLNGATAKIQDFTNPGVMNKLIGDIMKAKVVRDIHAPGIPLWMGETSSCYGGGASGLSDTYVAGFLWLDKLGVAAKTGIKSVLRQDFYGGRYGLIHPDTLEPLPDYWLTLLYKKLVGGPVLTADTNTTDNVRVYAHCTNLKSEYGYPPGSMTVYVLLTDPGTVVLSFPQFLKQRVDLFWLNPQTNLTSQQVLLGNQLLQLEDDTLPDMNPSRVYDFSYKLTGQRFGFLVFPQANVKACM